MKFLKAKYRKRLLLWIAALESGKYKKGTSSLKTQKGKYCCLGVACELFGLVPEKSIGGLNWYYDGESAYLPPKVKKWLGLSNNQGAFGWTSLVHVNDTTRGFKEVLKVLKDPPRSLFADEAILGSVLRKEAK